MLREVGKRDEDLLEQFLKENYERIPRTCLRYAIEKFEEEKRMMYLKNNFEWSIYSEARFQSYFIMRFELVLKRDKLKGMENIFKMTASLLRTKNQTY